jgi:hypothetical protein
MSNAPRLFVFDDLSDHILACRTLEVAPVMILPEATFLELATLGIAARLRRFLDAAVGPRGSIRIGVGNLRAIRALTATIQKIHKGSHCCVLTPIKSRLIISGGGSCLGWEARWFKQ